MKTIKESLEESKELKTDFYTITDMKISLLDYPVNAYKTMVNMGMKTWGEKSNKWEDLSPKNRFYVIKEILQKKVLPLALEHPTFSFSVEHIDRSTFDQLARARVGIVFASRGQKDDYLDSLGCVIPTRIVGTKYEQLIKEHIIKSKELYHEMQKDNIPNWARRCVLPMYSEHSFIFSANLMAIQGLISKRLETTEQEGCIVFSLLLREEIKKQYPLLTHWLRPSCDFTKKDMTSNYNGFSDIVSVPHASDNRRPGYDKIKYPPTWDEPCSNMSMLEEKLNVSLPKEWNDDLQFPDLSEIDKERFCEN